MVHSWTTYERAKEAYQRLLESGMVKEKDEKMIRGIIQIVFEES